MSADIPETEPVKLQAGDTVAWTKSLDDFEAGDGWTLTYAARGAIPSQSLIDITSTADGDDFSISVTAATTAQWVAGRYTLVGYVSNATERYEVYRGAFEVTANIDEISEGQSFDGRTFWERVRDKLQSVIEDGVIRETIRYTYNGVSNEIVTMEDAFSALAYAESKVEQEQNRGKTRRILTRFQRP